MKKEIKLSFSKSDFEDVYSKNKIYNLWSHKDIRVEAIICIVLSIALYTLAWVYGIPENGTFVTSFFIVLVFLGFMLWQLYKTISTIVKWQNDIKAFLDKQKAVKNSKIIMTDDTFSLIQDDEVFIETLKTLKTIQIKESYIYLIGASEYYLIPQKAVSESDYAFLKTKLSSQ